MRQLKLIGVVAILASALSAHAQFFQPWTGPAKSFTSRIKSCPSPIQTPAAAYDDFVSASSTNLTTLMWWGNVSSGAQLSRRYFVGIYNSIPGACIPALSTGPLYHTCVVPAFTAPVGTDCTGHTVYLFLAFLPGGFSATAGTKYWLQISESDAASVNVGVDDFRWSGHFTNVMCPACQITAAGTVVSPLTGCGALNDLAFGIF